MPRIEVTGFDLDDVRPNEVRRPQRQPLPRLHEQSQLRVFRALVGNRAATQEAVLPVQRHRRRAPLRLELVGSFVGRGSSEVEHRAAVGDRRLDHAPVQKMIRTERIEIADRRRPGHFDHRARPERHTGGDGSAAAGGVPHDHQARALRKRPQHFLEEPAGVHRRAEIAHVAREHGVEIATAARRRLVRRSGPTSSPCGSGCAPFDRAGPTCPRPDRSRIVTLCCLHGSASKRRPMCRSSTCRQPRVLARLRAAARSASATVVRVGDHAAVVHERQRGHRATKEPAADFDERENPGDLAAPAAPRDQVEAGVAERPLDDVTPRPVVVSRGSGPARDVRRPGRSIGLTGHRDRRGGFGGHRHVAKGDRVSQHRF